MTTPRRVEWPFLLVLVFVPATSATGIGGIVVEGPNPVEFIPETWLGVSFDAVGCPETYGCSSEPFTTIVLAKTAAGWFASIPTGPWNPTAVFGPLTGSPQEGFHYDSDSETNTPFWGCVGTTRVYFSLDPIAATHEDSYFVLDVERTGTTLSVPPSPCYGFTMIGNAAFDRYTPTPDWGLDES